MGVKTYEIVVRLLYVEINGIETDTHLQRRAVDAAMRMRSHLVAGPQAACSVAGVSTQEIHDTKGGA